MKVGTNTLAYIAMPLYIIGIWNKSSWCNCRLKGHKGKLGQILQLILPRHFISLAFEICLIIVIANQQCTKEILDKQSIIYCHAILNYWYLVFGAYAD
jgi:hypothetical protein